MNPGHGCFNLIQGMYNDTHEDSLDPQQKPSLDTKSAGKRMSFGSTEKRQGWIMAGDVGIDPKQELAKDLEGCKQDCKRLRMDLPDTVMEGGQATLQLAVLEQIKRPMPQSTSGKINAEDTSALASSGLQVIGKAPSGRMPVDANAVTSTTRRAKLITKASQDAVELPNHNRYGDIGFPIVCQEVFRQQILGYNVGVLPQYAS